jgi:hypothetical protein
MHGSAAFIMRSQWLIRKLLYQLKVFATALTLILVQRHSFRIRVLKLTVPLERVLINSGVLRTAESRRILAAC